MELEGPLLVIAAHPDDEAIGAGGLLARMGGTVLVLTKPYTKGREDQERYERSIRAQEQIMVDVPGLTYLRAGMQDEQLRLDEAITAIEDAIDITKAATIVCPTPHDMNQDHRVAAEATAIAARLSRRPSVRTILTMEIMSSTDQGLEPPPGGALIVQIDWFAKGNMLAAYDHELWYAPERSTVVLQALARVRGAPAGVQFAEAFTLVRSIFRAA